MSQEVEKVLVSSSMALAGLALPLGSLCLTKNHRSAFLKLTPYLANLSF